MSNLEQVWELSGGSENQNGGNERYALYNPIDNGQVTVRIGIPYLSLATGINAQVHQVNARDGDIFLKQQ